MAFPRRARSSTAICRRQTTYLDKNSPVVKPTNSGRLRCGKVEIMKEATPLHTFRSKPSLDEAYTQATFVSAGGPTRARLRIQCTASAVKAEATGLLLGTCLPQMRNGCLVAVAIDNEDLHAILDRHHDGVVESLIDTVVPVRKA